MDIKIENNDICLKPNGEAVLISGIEQAVQQVILAVRIPKNSFIYDRNLGINGEVDYYTDGIEKKIEALINECLVHTDVSVKVLFISRNGERIVIGIEVYNGCESCNTEVVING